MDFETFINKYSFINTKFVKDFYNIIKEDYIERYNEFLIDSEIQYAYAQIAFKQNELQEAFNNLKIIREKMKAIGITMIS
jgi:hypothetical protein